MEYNSIYIYIYLIKYKYDIECILYGIPYNIQCSLTYIFSKKKKLNIKYILYVITNDIKRIIMRIK